MKKPIEETLAVLTALVILAVLVFTFLSFITVRGEAPNDAGVGVSGGVDEPVSSSR